MPEPLQTIFLWIAAVLACVILLSAALIALRDRSFVPVLMVMGAFAAILMEPVVTNLGHAFHPEQGQINLFKTVDRAIPWHLALGYTFGFGLFDLLIYNSYVNRTLSSGFIWRCVVITAICYFVGEAYPVSHGLWVYQAPQALQVWSGTAPLTWNWLNACSMLTSVTLMLVALRHLRGAAKVLLIPLSVAGAFMGHMGAGFPMYNALNSDWPTWVMQLSGVASIGMSILICWLCSIILLDLQDKTAA